jgi:hypothetical protein
MRRTRFVPLSLTLLLTMPAGARAGDSLKAVVEKAIKAHGGAEKIAKP